MSAIDDLTYRVYKDGYDIQYPSRQTVKFLNATIRDDEVNKLTEIDLAGTITSYASLETILNNNNSAGNQKIINLASPQYSMDAVNKMYVDGYSIPLSSVLSKGNTTAGNHINLTGGSYIYSSDGNVLVNDRLDVAAGISSTAGDVVLYDNINMGNTYSIINLPSPTNSTDAANKSYVDNKVSTNLGYYFWTTSIINGASDGYQHLVTLPATTSGSLDGTTIEIYGGPWTQYPYAATVYLTNRDNYGGYIVSNRNFNNNLKIKTFIQADNTVQVWAHLTGTYQRFNLNITSTNYTSKGALVTVTTYPPGTLLWDSSNTSASYGDVTSNSLTSTDNSLVRFDGTSGKIVQNSLAVLDDTGNLNLNSGAGVLTCGTPTASGHAATKGYVDGLSVGTKVTGTITSGTAYQTIATITPSIASTSAKTIVIRLYSSKNKKNQEVRYTVYNSGSALTLANEATTNALAASDTTTYNIGHSLKMLVSGSDVLVQVLQESGVTTTFTLYYLIWTI